MSQGWQPGQSGYAGALLSGGPLDGKTYTDLPVGEDGSAPTALFVPVPSPDPAVGLKAVYEVTGWDAVAGRWTYSFAGHAQGEPDPESSELPVGTSVSFPKPSRPQPQELQMQPVITRTARRFVDGQRWWIASELCRRSTAPLLIRRNGGQAIDLIMDPEQMPLPSPVLVHFGEIIDGPNIAPMPWQAAFAADDPHEVVKLLEGQLGLHGSTPPTTPRVLAYRLIAHALTARVNARATLRVDWAAEFANPLGHDLLAPFAAAFEHIYKRYSPTFHASSPHELAWLLRQDGRPIALIDEDGWAHDVLGGRKHFTPAYGKTHNLEQVYSTHLAPLLQ